MLYFCVVPSSPFLGITRVFFFFFLTFSLFHTRYGGILNDSSPPFFRNLFRPEARTKGLSSHCSVRGVFERGPHGFFTLDFSFSESGV